MQWIYQVCLFMKKAVHKLIVMPVLKSALHECGKNVSIGRKCDIAYKNTSLGNSTSIGDQALFISSRAQIKIGSHVMIAPQVTMITGNHRTDLVGRYMSDITDAEKLPENDQDIVIEDDVWIAARVTILKGVTVGRGSVVAAGSVVTKDVEPYTVYGGVPARMIRKRFSPEQIDRHEKLLRQDI